ncbi:hypothetical protein J3R30DRAFT_3449475 [Lentinula aciculospora]|uniref:Uncharacterized protein n=1 Tax=Lentinula aciculospora TaxID=153920 RepID=A0A9W9ALR3_9AGAR|nr:hypothetical protein J3R30DRAFT_3449475 [Lentinula aciculospora]
MKFFAVTSFCLLVICATTVSAATDAEKACGFAEKIGSPCVIKLDKGHTVPGTCQKKTGFKVLRHRTCVPTAGGAAPAGETSPSPAASSDAASPTGAASSGSADTSSASTT